MIPRKEIIIIFVVILGILFTVPFYASGYIVSLLVTILMYSILASSWNFLSGYTGYVSLGSAAFVGIGAYVTVACWHLIPLPLIIVFAGLASMVFAALVGSPCLRIRGPYFVILTFGLAEAVKFIVQQFLVRISANENILVGAPPPEIFFYSLLAIFAIVIIMDHVIRNSKFGLGLISIRGNEEAAEAMGVNTTNYKLFAFMISALFMGMVGVVMALRWTYIITNTAFNASISFQIMIMAVLGGSKDFRGPLVGAIVLTIISEAFGSTFPYFYMILLGLVLIIIVKFVPKGIMGLLGDRSFSKLLDKMARAESKK